MTRTKFRLSILTTVFMVGCGGMKQDDMMKYALRSAPETKTDAATPATTAASPTNSQSVVVSNSNNVAPSQTAAPNQSPVVSAVSGTPANPLPPNSNAVAVNPEAESQVLSDTIPPGTTLSLVERRQKTLENLDRIGRAFESRLATTNRYPSHAIYSGTIPLLSWRVTILPELGYQKLYKAFKKDEPWNSISNQQLLKHIPSVFQSPERLDTKTNYLVPVGTSSPFGQMMGAIPRRWEDGAQNVAMVLEVDDALAVEWTKPEDYRFDATNPSQGLASLREDGLFMVWCGGGQVARIAKNTSRDQFKAMFTVDGGERFSAAAISLLATPKPENSDSKNPEALASNSDESPTAVVTSSNNRPTNGSFNNDVASTDTDDSLVEQAVFAYQSGQEHAAVQLTQICYLTDRFDPVEDYKWIPILKRPSPFVRIGVTLDYSGPNVKQLDKLYPTDSTTNRNWSGQRGALVSTAGLLADRVLEQLERLPAVAPEAVMLGINRPENRLQNKNGIVTERVVPGVAFLGAGTSSKMQQYAKQTSIDILITFETEEREARNKKLNKSTKMILTDVQRNKKIYESPMIGYRKRDNMLRDPLYKDPIEVAIIALETILQEKLQPTDFPDLKPRHALARCEYLSKVGGSNPLASLAEIQLYRKLNLLNLSDVNRLFSSVLGEEKGLTLLAGSAPEQQVVLQEFVPRIQAPETKTSNVTSRNN